MDNQFDISKYVFAELTLSNSPPTENDIKILEEEEAYYQESKKIKITCCCKDTCDMLKKLYDFKDIIIESDYKIFKNSLINHPFEKYFKSKTNWDISGCSNK